MATAGLHPVVALYSTFLNRAFDQLLMDVGLHEQGVTVVLDRAGITGTDGASHNGMWDLAICGIVPGLMMAAPRDRAHLESVLWQAIDIDDRPTVIRYSKDPMPETVEVLRTIDEVDVLKEGAPGGVLMVAHGQLCGAAVEAATSLGEEVTVVSPRWALPINPALVSMARESRAVVSVEDGLVSQGLGAQLSARLRESAVWTPTCELGVPKQFLAQASRSSIMKRIGLDAPGIAESVNQFLQHI